MKRLTFSSNPKLDTALLLPQNLVYPQNKGALGTEYFMKIGAYVGEKIGDRVVAISLYQPSSGKLKKKDLVVFAEEILEYCATMGITTLLVAQSDYFKYLAGVKALEKHVGEQFQCVVPNYEDIKVLPMLNHTAVQMFPEKTATFEKALKAAAGTMSGTYAADAEFEFDGYDFLTDPSEIKQKFVEYGEYEYLACDIETTGLYVGTTELLTISFAKSKTEAFTIPLHSMYGFDEGISGILKEFLKQYNGTLIFHNGLFDVKHIIYTLFMEDFNDVTGMLEGLDAIEFDDTFIMAYLLLNSTVRPSLGLKDLTYEYLGEYGENVKESTKIPIDDLAIYNSKDTVGTFYVFEKYKEALDLDVYQNIMKPSFRPLLKMMLNGMPLDLVKVTGVETLLEADLKEARAVLYADEHVQLAMRQLRMEAADKYNATHKVKQKTPEDFTDLVFNPNSTLQLRTLLFDVMEFEPIDHTPTKQPKTDRASIKEFLEAAEQNQKAVLGALVTISQAGIVLNTFIHAFKELSITQGDQTTLHGSLVLGGTQSGRLSSRDPNMQNLPSNSAWGKAIKSCFIAPDGWLFGGADFNALEDKIGAILSKDPVKLKENLLGFDGHSLRANAFFPEELAEIGLGDLDPDDASSINRIKDEAEAIRQNAKPISFLKQYGGGVGKIQKVLKCTRERAQKINDAYDELYRVTLQFNQRNIEFARAHGYMECAFGLRLKTPRIKSRDDAVRSSEERSSNNAVTQSWGMLTNRAFIEFDQRIEAAGLSHKIKLISTIHDAIYLAFKNEVEVIKWINDNLIECMEWQDHPMLKSEIKLGAELDIGESWDKQYTIPNGVSSFVVERAHHAVMRKVSPKVFRRYLNYVRRSQENAS